MKIKVLLFFVVGITAFAFNAKIILTKLQVTNKQEVVAKPNFTKKEQKKTATNTTLSMNPQQDIVGTWLMENSPSDKWVFTSNTINAYIDNNLRWSATYEFVDVLPNGNSIPAGEYLMKFTNLDDGDISYNWVYDVSPNAGSYLTLISEDTGRMGIFIKQ